jgi:hypothetical protein
MSRWALVCLAVWMIGCGNRQKKEPQEEAGTPAAPAEQASPPRLQRVPSPGQESGQVRADSNAPASTDPVEMPKPAPGLKNVLVPPATPGSSSVALDGCLAQAERTEQAGSRFPEPPATRGPVKSTVEVSPLGGGALVVHELSHACCLKAEVSSALEGRTVTVTEVLSGQPCRCRCRSTVRAAVGLPPGEYTLKIVTDENGKRSSAHEAPLSVR